MSPLVSRRLLGPFVGLLLAAAFCSNSASAKSSQDLRYTRSQIFSGALRYLRIDLGYEVTEKDPDAAYLLFRYVPQGKNEPTFGAVEIIERDKSVQLSIKLPAMPTYHEAVIRDGLVQKLRDEYGAEPKRPEPEEKEKPKEPSEAPDDGSKSPKSKEDRSDADNLD